MVFPFSFSSCQPLSRVTICAPNPERVSDFLLHVLVWPERCVFSREDEESRGSFQLSHMVVVAQDFPSRPYVVRTLGERQVIQIN